MPTPGRKICLNPNIKRHDDNRTQETTTRPRRTSGVRNPFAFYQNVDDNSNSQATPSQERPHSPVRAQYQQKQQQHKNKHHSRARKPTPLLDDTPETREPTASGGTHVPLDSNATTSNLDRCADIFERFAKRNAELDSRCEPVLQKLENTPMAIKMRAARHRAARAAAAEASRPKATANAHKSTPVTSPANISHALTSGGRRRSGGGDDKKFGCSGSHLEIKFLNFQEHSHSKRHEPCPVFQRVGRCLAFENGTCHKSHDPDQFTICPKFERGECRSRNCLLSHNVAQLSACRYYPHQQRGSKAKVGEPLQHGYCRLADDSELRNEFVCPHVERHGACPIVKCIHCKNAQRWSSKLSALRSHKESSQNSYNPKFKSDELQHNWQSGAAQRCSKSKSVRMPAQYERKRHTPVSKQQRPWDDTSGAYKPR